jgi:predicted RNA binding protein YcfA (HicA-like mRNA interferase family)
MNLTGKHLTKVALKLGFVIKEGSKHILVYDQMGNFITIFSRGKIKKKGTLAAIIKQMGITEAELKNLL